MPGHVDSRILIAADPDVVWRVGNSSENDRRHSDGADRVTDTDSVRNAVQMHIVSPPDAAGRVWVYDVERVADPASRTVYARRWNNRYFLYSHAIWSYLPVDGGTELRCVQDFEMTPDSPVDDDEMAEIIRTSTEAAMRKTAQFVAETPQSDAD